MFKEHKDHINEWFEEYFKNKGTHEKIIYDAMEYSIVNGGKRIRPILMMLVYDMYKEDVNEVMPFACALEMIHAYSLIHDDLPCMDDDDLRRGKPTNHKVFGEAIAVLAGDCLLNEAFNIMLKEVVKEPSKARAAEFIGNKAGVKGMIGGQVVDIISEGRQISKEELDFIHLNKTAALIEAAIVAGAMLGEAPKEEIKLLNDFAIKLGLAFQIKDDILDVIGNEEKLGKKINSDAEKEKNTYVKLFDVEKCEKIAEELTDKCFDLLNKVSRNTENLQKLTQFLLDRDF